MNSEQIGSLVWGIIFVMIGLAFCHYSRFASLIRYWVIGLPIVALGVYCIIATFVLIH